MAIGFARVSIHSRSQGHSAVAGSAYRSGSLLIDARSGVTHNYQNRDDVVYSEILLPDDADQKFLNRELLWNIVEACEKRKDAQVAKDVILALPRDLEKSHLIALAKNFADYHFVSKGLVADVAIHDHGDDNPHAHIFVTTRRLHGSAFDRYKARDLNPTFANGRGGKGFISEQDYWGEQWRDFQNEYFQKNHLDLIVDENHLLSQRHQGRVQGKEAHYLREENELKRQACVEIALHDTDGLMNRISQRYAVFSERQLASLIFKNTETAEQFAYAMSRVKSHRDIVCLGVGDDDKLRYTTRANYLKEARLAEQTEKLANSTSHSVNSSRIKQTIARYDLNHEQQRALEHVLDGADISAIVGRAGTGKSYLMKAANECWQRAGFKVIGVSVSGVAAKGLQLSSQIHSSTIASFKLKLRHHKNLLNKNTVVVMDEAGMTNLHDMAFVIDKIKRADAKLVLIGDPNQLQPIGPGAPFRALIERIGFAEMETIRRQEKAGDQEASQHLALGNIDEAIDYYEDKGAIHWHKNSSDAMTTLIDRWAKTTNTDQLKQQLILAHRNCDIHELNQLARTQLKTENKLDTNEHTIEINKRVASLDGWQMQTVKDTLTIAIDERILFRRNDKNLGIVNGDFGTITAIQKETLHVKLDDGRDIHLNLKQYNEFDYGYAATVHKAQGATLDRVFVYAGGQGWNQHLAYVALTRHRKHVELHVDHDTFQSKDTLKKQFSRQEIKDSVLDWPISYARRRGFDPESLIGRLIEKMGHIKETIKDRWGFMRNFSAQEKQATISKTSETKNKPSKTAHPLKDKSLEWEQLKSIDQPQIKLIYQLYQASKNKTDKRTLDKIYSSILQLADKTRQNCKVKDYATRKAPKLMNTLRLSWQGKSHSRGVDR